MKIKSAKISNILSIEDAYVQFDDNGLLLISGWNYDSNRANGAGKTAIFNAITFALYDKLPRKISATEILRREARTGFCELEVVLNDDIYVIRRTRPKGVSVHKNGNKIEITQQEWENLLKLNYTQFLISAYCSQGSDSRFLSLNDADKKQFLLQLLNIEQFSLCKSIADDKVKKEQQAVDSLQSKLEAARAKLDAYKESLIDEEEIHININKNNNLLEEYNKRLKALQLIEKPNIAKLQEVEDALFSKKNEYLRARTKKEMLHDQYKKLTRRIVPFDEKANCSSCGAPLDNEQARISHEKQTASVKEELKKIKLSIDDCDSILVKENETNALLNKAKEKKKELLRAYEEASIDKVEIQGKMEYLRKQTENMSIKLSFQQELNNKIKALNENIKIATLEIANINRKIELYKTISAVYSTTGAQAYVLDSIIESFNERISEKVAILWPNMTYSFNSYKENAKGEISAKFSETLTMDGKQISIGSLSGGEFRALSLCVDFTLIDIMEHQFGIQVSPIALDEPFDGLDVSGKELIMELLAALSANRQIIVIDHSSELSSSFNKAIKIEKRNGISTIASNT